MPCRNTRRQFLAAAGLSAMLTGCLRLSQDETPTSRTERAATPVPTTAPEQTVEAAKNTAEPTTANPETESEPNTSAEQTETGQSNIAGSWPQFQRDAANIGHHAGTTGPKQYPAELWSFATDAGFTVTQNPIVAEGTVVIGSNDKQVYGINVASGSERWSVDTGAEVWGTAGYSDGTVLIGSGGNADETPLSAIDIASGELLWRRNLNANQIAPAIHDGVAYFLAGKLYALNISSGSFLWAEDLSGENWGKTSPAVADGTVHVGIGGARPTGSGTNDVFAVATSDGSRQWKTTISEKVTKRCPQTVADGTLFVGGHGGTLFALDADEGSERWSFSVGDGIMSSPAVRDGSVYVGSGHWEVPGRSVYALNLNDGSKQWEFEAGGSVFGSPAVVDGIVYTGDGSGTVTALDAADGTVIWRYGVGQSIDTAPVVLDDTVFVAASDGVVHALRAD